MTWRTSRPTGATATRSAPARFYTVRDASRWNKLALAASALKVLYVVARERPDVVVSTGAAPGYLALRFAKLIGAQTAWVDSVANVEEMSLSGQMASTKADLCLTQWPHLSGGRVGYRGRSCDLRDGRHAAAVRPHDRRARRLGRQRSRTVRSSPRSGPGQFAPRHIQYRSFISPAECRDRMLAADAIVAHAGMGTILTALELGKPLLVVPRRASLGEHRNEHQLATARRFADTGRLLVAFDESELAQRLDELPLRGRPERISPFASDQLITALRSFIDGDDGTPLAA